MQKYSGRCYADLIGIAFFPAKLFSLSLSYRHTIPNYILLADVGRCARGECLHVDPLMWTRRCICL